MVPGVGFEPTTRHQRRFSGRPGIYIFFRKIGAYLADWAAGALYHRFSHRFSHSRREAFPQPSHRLHTQGSRPRPQGSPAAPARPPFEPARTLDSSGGRRRGYHSETKPFGLSLRSLTFRKCFTPLRCTQPSVWVPFVCRTVCPPARLYALTRLCRLSFPAP